MGERLVLQTTIGTIVSTLTILEGELTSLTLNLNQILGKLRTSKYSGTLLFISFLPNIRKPPYYHPSRTLLESMIFLPKYSDDFIVTYFFRFTYILVYLRYTILILF